MIFQAITPYSVSENPRFCVADFATLSNKTRSSSKISPLFTWIKEPCVQKFERLERSKLLGISQTMDYNYFHIGSQFGSASP